MAKIKESINSSIFFALKNSETSGVPTLLIASPGFGKSTTVEMFAKLRGYELIVLRGSTMSETEVMGFDAVNQKKDGIDVRHCRPTWFEQLLSYDAQGKKTLLFLDEILGCNAYIQSALLNLIFERKVDAEKLPDSCLIVAAGNHINNMTNEFQALSALWNRFCIYNITADENALDEFLSYYDGASTGEMKDFMKLKAESLARMDAQKVDMSDDMKNRVCQYFETAIRETTRSLMKSGDKPLDLNCTETQSIYTNQEGDELMRGFISLRTLGYLVKSTIATYFNFGKSGIKSTNFKRMIEGLCGLALSRKNGDIVKTKVAENYYQSLIQTLSSIDKLSNTKIKVYEDFFNKVASNTKTELSQEEITAILAKFTEMANDSEVKDVSKPIEDAVVTKLCDLIKHNSRKIITIRIKPDEDITKTLTTEKCTGMISKWNYMSDMYNKIATIVQDPKNSYPESITKAITTTKEKLTEDFMKLGSYSKLTATNYPEFKTLMPEIKKLN